MTVPRSTHLGNDHLHRGRTGPIPDDVDAHHDHACVHGGEILYAPTDQPYGYREYSARDPEGGMSSFMAPATS